MSYFSKYQLIVFDLDNTLIIEKDYLFQAYKEISFYLESICFVDKLKIENFLKDEFMKNGRTKLFNKLITRFNISEIEIKRILNILRSFTPQRKINLIKNMKLILQGLKDEKIPYVIFTNGNVDQQKNKVANIEWDGLLTNVIYANEIKPKPDPLIFNNYLLKNKIKINKSKILMIGDSVIDELFCKNFGCDYIHVSKFY